MPPEQALGRSREVDALSDVWAVGATAFPLMAGRFVDEGETAEEILVRAATQPAPPLASLAWQVPLPVARVIDRALAFEKRDRWQSARAMRDALATALDPKTSSRRAAHEDGEEEKTRVAPPPEMTLHEENRVAGELVPADSTEGPPTLPAASTVAGVSSSNGAVSHPRRRVRFLVMSASVLGLAASLAIAVAMGFSAQRRELRPSASTPEPGTHLQFGVASDAGSTLPVTAATSNVATAVPVEALPQIGRTASSATPAVAMSSVPRPAATVPTAVTGTRQRSPRPSSAPKHDPLAP